MAFWIRGRKSDRSTIYCHNCNTTGKNSLNIAKRSLRCTNCDSIIILFTTKKAVENFKKDS